MEFRIFSSNGLDVGNMPVKFSYSGGYLINEKGRSDEKGNVRALLEKVNSSNEIETLKAKIDFTEIINHATKDPLIRKMLSYLKVNECILFLYQKR